MRHGGTRDETDVRGLERRVPMEDEVGASAPFPLHHQTGERAMKGHA